MQRIGYIPGFAIWFFITSRQFGVLVFFLQPHSTQELKMGHLYLAIRKESATPLR